MTPNTIDCGLVMTAVQSNVLPALIEQPARWEPVKCAYVS